MRNKKIIFAAIISAAVIALGWLFIYEPEYDGLITEKNTLVFAHRGFGNHGPDNSLVAANLAMKNGMDGVDVDGQQTADKEIAIYHDLSVDRLTTGTGKVSAKTMDELRKLDLATKFGGFTEAPVSSFEDFVKDVTPRGILMVELKVLGTNDTGAEKRVAEIIQKYNAHEKIYISSFNPFVLYRLKKIDPEIRTAFIFMDTNWNPELLAEIRPEDRVDLPWFLRQEWIRRGIRKIIKPDALSVNHEVSEKTIDTFGAKNYPIFLWTIDDETRINWALDKKPRGIISDEPMRAKQLRDAKK